MNRKLEDENFKQENKARAKISMTRRLQDDQLSRYSLFCADGTLNPFHSLTQDDQIREKNKARAKISMKRRLQDDQIRETNRARARISMKRRLQDDQIRETKRARAKISMKRRLNNEAIKVKTEEERTQTRKEGLLKIHDARSRTVSGHE